jgi:hypothetical protein
LLVSISGFGSLWRRRINKDEGDAQRFARAVYYNTTGVEIAGTIRQRPRIAGYTRFHSRGGFDANHTERMITRVFECAQPCVWQSHNKLLFERLLRISRVPDAFLVAARAQEVGRLKVGTSEWRSTDTWLISFSEDGAQQEAMLLMPAGGWIETAVGRLALQPEMQRPWIGRLVLISGGTTVASKG